MAAEEAFSKPEELLNHLKVSHPGQQPECPKCKASFDFDDYISHLVSSRHVLALAFIVRPWLRDPRTDSYMSRATFSSASIQTVVASLRMASGET